MSRQIDWKTLRPIWEDTPRLVAAWAFGSAKEGMRRAGGDVDIGVLVEPPFTLDEQLKLLGRLQNILQIEELDLVILNEANPILRFEALSGRRLFCRDDGRCAAFASLTAREYEDEMAQWQRALRWQRPRTEGKGETARGDPVV